MDQNLGNILWNSPVGCDESGIFVMSYLRVLVRQMLLDPNLFGNYLKGHASLGVFLSRLEKALFSDDISESTQSNLSAEEWKALRGLAVDKTIVMKAAYKGSSVVVRDRSDYLHEASRQLQDQCFQ